MSFDSTKFDADELLHLAIDSANRDDHGQAIAYLKAAQEKDLQPRDFGRLTYFLGAEYAQIGLYDRAVEAMQSAVDADPELYTAHFQLGLLHLTSGRAMAAREAWVHLGLLEDVHPEFYLKLFKQGLEALIEDNFSACREWLGLGMARNNANVPLNGDMQKILDALPPVDGPAQVAPKEIEESAKEPEEHLYLSAYRNRNTH